MNCNFPVTFIKSLNQSSIKPVLIFKLIQENTVDGIISKYEILFGKEHEYLKQLKASTEVGEGVQPIFLRSRPVP